MRPFLAQKTALFVILAACISARAQGGFTPEDFKKSGQEALRLLSQVGNEPGIPSKTRATLMVGKVQIDMDRMWSELNRANPIPSPKPISADGAKSAYANKNGTIDYYPGDFVGKTPSEIRVLVLHEILRLAGLGQYDGKYVISTGLGRVCDVQEEVEQKKQGGELAGELLITEQGPAWMCQTPNVKLACDWDQWQSNPDDMTVVILANGQSWYGPCYGRIPVCMAGLPSRIGTQADKLDQLAGPDPLLGGVSDGGGGGFAEQEFSEIGANTIHKFELAGNNVVVGDKTISSFDLEKALNSAKFHVGKKGDKLKPGELLLEENLFKDLDENQKMLKFLEVILPKFPQAPAKIFAAIEAYRYAELWPYLKLPFHYIGKRESFYCPSLHMHFGCYAAPPAATYKEDLQINMNIGQFWRTPCGNELIMCYPKENFPSDPKAK